jgi:ABC-type transporter Mla MlaB component
MGLQLTYIPEEQRLDLTLSENLDHTLAAQFMQTGNYVNERLRTCVIDCSRVKQVYYAGRVLFLHLLRVLQNYRVRLIILGGLPDNCLQAVSLQYNQRQA